MNFLPKPPVSGVFGVPVIFFYDLAFKLLKMRGTVLVN